MEYVLKGWLSEKEQVDALAREYWNFREELSVEDGMLFTVKPGQAFPSLTN